MEISSRQTFVLGKTFIATDFRKIRSKTGDTPVNALKEKVGLQ